MLFDLSGKRRRVVQVVYATLAILMGGSLVLFGIGSDAPGGILDALGLGGGDTSGSSSAQFEEEVEDAENRLEENPNDPRALVDLAHYRYLSGFNNPDSTETELAPDAREELALALDAWDRYLKTKPKRVDSGTATEMATIHDRLFQDALVAGDAGEALAEAEAAAETLRVATESDGNASDFGTLARYLYVTGDVKAADAAAARAVELSEPAQRQQIERLLEQTAEQGAKLNERLDKAVKAGAEAGGGASGGGPIEDPFGGLAPAGGGTVPPASTP